MTDNILDQVRQINAELAKLVQRQAELAEELARAAMLQKFEPRAFAHGSCKIGGRHYPPFKATWRLTLGNGEVIEHDALDVPKHLWPEAMRKAYDALPKHARPKLRAGE